MHKFITFDIGGTKIKHGVMNRNGEFIEKDKYDTDCYNYDVFIDRMSNVIDIYRGKYDVEGIAISMPGFIDINTGYAAKAGAVVALDGKNLKELFEKKTGIRVEIENDANCVTLAEKLNGNAVNCSDYICFTIGTGIGGGIVINNKILHGHKNMGGEFGFMRIDLQTKDNLHLNSCMAALIRRYKEYMNLSQETNVEGHEIFEACSTDAGVNNIVENWYRNIAVTLYNLSVTLNPEKILIGGGVSERADLISKIEFYLKENEFWPEIKPELEICYHKNDAGMIGALYHFISKE